MTKYSRKQIALSSISITIATLFFERKKGIKSNCQILIKIPLRYHGLIWFGGINCFRHEYLYILSKHLLNYL